MTKHSFIVAFRNILKGKSFSLINLSGLSIVLSTVFFILVYYFYENSYDHFLTDNETIYRVSYTQTQNNSPVFEKATSVYAIGPLLKDNLPEVERYARGGYETCLVFKDNIIFNDVELLWADSTFLQTVPLHLTMGSNQSALTEPYTMVLSHSMAQKYFGQENPIGQTVYINKNMPFRVTGVFDDIPQNSHFNFKLLISLSTLDKTLGDYGTKDRGWYGEDWLYTYIKTSPGTNPARLEEKINQLTEAHLPDHFKTSNTELHFSLQPVKEIHLLPTLDNEFKPKGNKQNLLFILLIGLLLLLITWVNYVNISASRFFEKIKNINIRKIIGATRFSLITDFTIEALLLNLVAGVVAFMLSEIAIPWFDTLSGKPLSAFLSNHLLLFSYFPVAIILITAFSGLFAIFSIASLPPVHSSSHTRDFGLKNSWIKKGLTIFQLTASMALIVSVIVIRKQINFIGSQNKGFNEENVLVLEAPKNLNMDSTKLQKYLFFRDQVLNMPEATAMTSSIVGVGDEVVSEGKVTHLNGRLTECVTLKSYMIDDGFIDVHDIQLLAGRNFNPNLKTNKDKILLNASAVKMLGFDAPADIIDNVLRLPEGENLTVIGVINDFNQENLHHTIKPTFFYHAHPTWFGCYSVKIASGNMAQTVAAIQDKWQQVYPNAPFDYHFLDSYLDDLYKADIRFGNIIMLFTIIAILVSCLGLIGLILIITSKKIKEIGIRKVNGASLAEILSLLNKDFVKWSVIAFVLASPLSWIAMHRWLSNFAYQTAISWWVFLLAGLAVTTIALLTVSWQSYRSAMHNPVEALKCD
ncbi:ABC transporter permease [Marinilabiliaceae bacterium JC017]|nr:ABC transporter permease [Marinilabiliaceae bacterium JC017]